MLKLSLVCALIASVAVKGAGDVLTCPTFFPPGLSNMSKTFYVAPGHEAVNRGIRHGAGLLLVIEEGESVDLYATSEAGPTTRLATFDYAHLDCDAPPIGLIRDNRGDVATYTPLASGGAKRAAG
ncbi:MAG TPA: hypothetical protein VJ890_15940 [Vineibacter sp.]|nr:hypothetical protein [Vineibacter sp.]